MNKTKAILASAYAATLSITFTVVITIWAELSAPLKDWLKNFSGHHWTSKSVFSLALYIAGTWLLYNALRDPDAPRLQKSLRILLASAALGTVALTAFYTGHHFGVF